MPSSATAAAQPPIRVMLVDDSAVVRGLISRALQKHDNIDIVATASDGDMAVSVLQRHPADVILLDIEMPRKNGLEALPLLKAIAPNAHIIMVSSLTQRNAEISLQALSLGATDYLAKPTAHGDTGALDMFYHELSGKVLSLGAAQQQRQGITPPPAPSTASRPLLRPSVATASPTPTPTGPPPKTNLRTFRPRAIAIASSTGGPQALVRLFTQLSQEVIENVPVFITQHMPPTFTALLAGHIAGDAKLNCSEGIDGAPVENGHVYVAPGDYHMSVDTKGTERTIRLDQNAPVNFCRPAADPMLESLSAIYGAGLLCIVLTGMGNDGTNGARAVKQAGGCVLTQDKESSVVWGMPGSVVENELQDDIMTIEEMANTLKRLLGGGI